MLKSWPYSQRTMLAAGLAVSLMLFPKSITTILVRAPRKPLVIHTSLREPPKEAFEDLFMGTEKSDDWHDLKSEATTNLNLGSEQKAVWNPIHQIGSRKVVLPVLHISQSTPDFQVADNSWIDGLSDDQKARVDAADDRHQVLSKDWSPSSWRDLAAEKIAAIRSSESPEPVNKIRIEGTKSDGTHVSINDIHQATVMLNPANVPGAKISGKVRLSPGLALGNRTLEARHMIDGVPLEVGRVYPQNGTITMNVADARGTIEVDMFGEDGSILASGKHRFTSENKNAPVEITVAAKSRWAANITDFNKHPERINDSPKTSIRGVNAEILYASIGVTDQTDVMGSLNFPKISESSWGLIRAKANGFNEAVFLVGAGEQKNLSLMPSSLIGALRDLTQAGPADQSGIIWGQVLFDGKPLAGVTVSMEMDQENKATYLAGFIPNQSLPATTENGYFIFPQLTRGMHSLIATRNGEYFGHLNVVVDDGAVSVGVIEATTHFQNVDVKLYDAFEGLPQRGQLQLQSLGESLPVYGQTQINLQNVHRLSLGHIQPASEEYMQTQLIYSDTDEYLHIPLIKTAWMEWLMSERRISAVPETGFVVGFVPEDDFEAYLPQESEFASENIVYFDLHGQIVPTGVAGGGFVMFNVPSGSQSVIVVSKKTEMLASQVLPVDPNSTSVINYRF